MASNIVDSVNKDMQVDVREMSGNKEYLLTDHSAEAPRPLSVGKVEEYWLIEAGACFLALAALLSTVGLLCKYDKKPVSSSLVAPWHLNILHREVVFHLGLSLNSIISLFSTIYKTALLIPVAACLAQLKWTWFSNCNKLSDFQLLDKSKETWGSIVLLWKWKLRRLASLGAFITLAALALDFAFQSLVTYGSEKVYLPTNATIPRRFDYTGAAGNASSSAYRPSSEMIAATYTGIFDSTGKHDIIPTCSTGNCTWSQPYASLGICSQCDDITDQIQQSCSASNDPISNPIFTNDTSLIGSCVWTLPDGHQLYQNGFGFYDLWASAVLLNITALADESQLASGFSNPLTQLTVLRAIYGDQLSESYQTEPSYPLPTVSASKCTMSFCAKQYKATVVNGKLEETVTSTFINDTATMVDPITYETTNYYITPPDFMNYTDSNGKPAQFIIAPYAVGAIGGWLDSLWTGNCTSIKDPFSDSNVATRIFDLDFANLVSMMDNLARMLTNTIRISTPNGGQDGAFITVPDTDTDTQAKGQTYRIVTVVHVKWKWVILPAVLLVMTLVFLTTTAINSATSNMTLWKDNSLAALTHGLTNEGRNHMAVASRVQDVDKIASDIQVKWVETNEGGRLVQL